MKNSLVLFSIFFASLGCDSLHRKKCEWYLVPEPKHRHLIKKGWVSLCARNYTINKQKCYFQAKLDFAEALHGKAFTLVSLEYEKDTFPRRIKSITPCTPEKQPS